MSKLTPEKQIVAWLRKEANAKWAPWGMPHDANSPGVMRSVASKIERLEHRPKIGEE